MQNKVMKRRYETIVTFTVYNAQMATSIYQRYAQEQVVFLQHYGKKRVIVHYQWKICCCTRWKRDGTVTENDKDMENCSQLLWQKRCQVRRMTKAQSKVEYLLFHMLRSFTAE